MEDKFMDTLINIFPCVEWGEFSKDCTKSYNYNFWKELEEHGTDQYKIIQTVMGYSKRDGVVKDRADCFQFMLPEDEWCVGLLNDGGYKNYEKKHCSEENYAGFFGYVLEIMNEVFYKELQKKKDALMNMPIEKFQKDVLFSEYHKNKGKWRGVNSLQCQYVDVGHRKKFVWSDFPMEWSFLSYSPKNLFTIFKRKCYEWYSVVNITLESECQEVNEFYVLKKKGEELLIKNLWLGNNNGKSFYKDIKNKYKAKFFGTIRVALEDVSEKDVFNYVGFDTLLEKFQFNFSQDKYLKSMADKDFSGSNYWLTRSEVNRIKKIYLDLNLINKVEKISEKLDMLVKNWSLIKDDDKDFILACWRKSTISLDTPMNGDQGNTIGDLMEDEKLGILIPGREVDGGDPWVEIFENAVSCIFKDNCYENFVVELSGSFYKALHEWDSDYRIKFLNNLKEFSNLSSETKKKNFVKNIGDNFIWKIYKRNFPLTDEIGKMQFTSNMFLVMKVLKGGDND